MSERLSAHAALQPDFIGLALLLVARHQDVEMVHHFVLVLEEDVVLKIYHMPYYLYTKKDSEVIAHLARFHSDSLQSQFEVIERVTLVEDSEGLVEGIVLEKCVFLSSGVVEFNF